MKERTHFLVYELFSRSISCRQRIEQRRMPGVRSAIFGTCQLAKVLPGLKRAPTSTLNTKFGLPGPVNNLVVIQSPSDSCLDPVTSPLPREPYASCQFSSSFNAAHGCPSVSWGEYFRVTGAHPTACRLVTGEVHARYYPRLSVRLAT